MPENNGWQSKDAVARYKKVIDFIVPGRREILETIAKLATDFKQNRLKVLDIGCGDGAVTTELESSEKMGDKPGTIWDMYRDLIAAGFSNIDCMLKIQNLAVMVATKEI